MEHRAKHRSSRPNHGGGDEDDGDDRSVSNKDSYWEMASSGTRSEGESSGFWGKSGRVRSSSSAKAQAKPKSAPKSKKKDDNDFFNFRGLTGDDDESAASKKGGKKGAGAATPKKRAKTEKPLGDVDADIESMFSSKRVWEELEGTSSRSKPKAREKHERQERKHKTSRSVSGSETREDAVGADPKNRFWFFKDKMREECPPGNENADGEPLDPEEQAAELLGYLGESGVDVDDVGDGESEHYDRKRARVDSVDSDSDSSLFSIQSIKPKRITEDMISLRNNDFIRFLRMASGYAALSVADNFVKNPPVHFSDIEQFEPYLHTTPYRALGETRTFLELESRGELTLERIIKLKSGHPLFVATANYFGHNLRVPITHNPHKTAPSGVGTRVIREDTNDVMERLIYALRNFLRESDYSWGVTTYGTCEMPVGLSTDWMM